MNTGHIFMCYKHKAKNNCFKALGTSSEVADFQGWSKMTLKIKTAHISNFRSRFQKIL